MVKEVQPRAQKIAEHQRKYEQKHEERKIKERIQRVKKAGKNMREPRGRSQKTIRISVWLHSRQLSWGNAW